MQIYEITVEGWKDNDTVHVVFLVLAVGSQPALVKLRQTFDFSGINIGNVDIQQLDSDIIQISGTHIAIGRSSDRQDEPEPEPATCAERISRLLGADGRFWRAHDSVGLDEYASRLGGHCTTQDDDSCRWDFNDGSALVCLGGIWDLALVANVENCFCPESLGPEHQDDCPRHPQNLFAD